MLSLNSDNISGTGLDRVGFYSLIAVGCPVMSVGGSHNFSIVDYAETGSGSGCSLNRGITLSRHLKMASLKLSPVASGRSVVW